MAQMQKQCAQNIELHAKTCSIYGCYAQILIWSKAEMFIHVATQNLVMHRAQENRWRTDICDQWYF